MPRATSSFRRQRAARRLPTDIFPQIDILIHITMLPIALAAGGTLIGFIASTLRLGS
jgi:hypothetical protein